MRNTWIVVKRTLQESRDDSLVHWAAALTYYGMLSLFPALLLLVSVLGLVGAPATQPLIDNLGLLAPGPAREIAIGAVENLRDDPAGSGLAAVMSVVGAVWAASGYVGAFMPAANAIWEVDEGRPLAWKLPVRLGLTLLLLMLIAMVALVVVLTGPIAEWFGTLFGLGDAALTAWGIAKWPVLLLMVGTIVAVLFWAAPNVQQPRFRWISAGSLVAIGLWLLASGGFGLYVSKLGSFNETYGALAGVVVLLVWMWVGNLALLVGAELNAELERARQIEAGMRPIDKEPYLPLRHARRRVGTDEGADA